MNAEEAADAPFRLFDEARQLDAMQLGALVEAWQAVDVGARRRAWESVRREARTARREEPLDEIRRAVSSWATQGYAGIQAGVFGTLQDADRGDARAHAAAPILDAMASVLLADRLSEDELLTLRNPWDSVVGQPMAEDGST
ncbi:MAG: hypothetical protein H0V12_10620 [Chloroflexi bacterium]|nr:hypothetical protein [Chloroflexota bacterium]MBA3891312.1 hypothetical protein [Gemmatimonadaceae bacterium]